MIPLAAGAAISGITGAISAISNLATAAEQRKRAQELRDKADKVQAPEIAPQFLEADKIAQWRAQNGMPALTQYKNDLDANLAQGVQAASGVSGSGSNTLNAVASLYGGKNRATNELNAEDAKYRDAGTTGLIESKKGLGEQVNANRVIQRTEQQNLRTGANQLENAATANNMSGTKQITNSLGQGAAGIAGALTKGADTSGVTTPAATPQTDVQAGYGTIQNVLGIDSPSSVTHPSQDTPENIQAIQQHLVDKGLYTGPVNGVYNPDLEAAISKYSVTGPYNAKFISPLYNQANP